jgi:hypothetical protein
MHEAGVIPPVSTPEYFAQFGRTAHLEDPGHAPRLHAAAALLAAAASGGARTLSDLGCGDGGLLSLVQHQFRAAWGYDLTPANVDGCAARGVTAELADVFGADRDRVSVGETAAVTEVLEHIADPHAALAWLSGSAWWLVASSPWNETAQAHDQHHCWAWDMPGYAAMITGAGWAIVRHEELGRFQLVLARTVITEKRLPA